VRVLVGDAVDRLDPVQEVVEAPRAEEDVERRRGVALDVDGDEALGERRLGRLQVPARDAELELRALEAPVDAPELDVGEVVRLDRPLEAAVDLLDLREDLLRLPLLRCDGARIGGRCTCRRERREESDDEGSRLTPTGADTRLRAAGTTGGPGGAGSSQVRHPSKHVGCWQPLRRPENALRAILYRLAQAVTNPPEHGTVRPRAQA
jgi:hypothetical protein